MTRVIALLMTIVMLAPAKSCDEQKPDPFGGCERHPGQCGRSQ